MQLITAGATQGMGSFNAITSIQHSRRNILTGADFKQPRVKSWLERLFEILKQKGQP